MLVHSAKLAEIDLIGMQGTPVAAVRNRLAAMALDLAPDFLLWADSDHRFPPDALERLLAHKKPVVGVNQLRRQPPHEPTAVRLVNGKGERVVTTREKAERGELEEVLWPGLGLCLVSAEATRAVAPPIFAGEHEDASFFTRLREVGFPAYADHALSMEVTHITETELSFRQVAS